TRRGSSRVPFDIWPSISSINYRRRNPADSVNLNPTAKTVGDRRSQYRVPGHRVGASQLAEALDLASRVAEPCQPQPHPALHHGRDQYRVRHNRSARRQKCGLRSAATMALAVLILVGCASATPTPVNSIEPLVGKWSGTLDQGGGLQLF